MRGMVVVVVQAVKRPTTSPGPRPSLPRPTLTPCSAPLANVSSSVSTFAVLFGWILDNQPRSRVQEVVEAWEHRFQYAYGEPDANEQRMGALKIVCYTIVDSWYVICMI